MTDTGPEAKILRLRDLRLPKRKMSPEWDNSDLLADMQERGQLEPIVVFNREIMDGVRRVQSLRSLQDRKQPFAPGTIYAYQPKTADEALALLPKFREARKFGKMWAERPTDWVCVYYQLAAIYKAERKGKARTSFRGKILDTMEIGQSAANGLLNLVNKFGDDPEQATPTEWLRGELELVIRGQRSVGYFMDQYRLFGMRGDIRGASSQRDVMAAMLSSLSGINAGLKTLGPLANDLTDEEIATWIERIRYEREGLTHAIRMMKKGKKGT